MTFLAFVGLGFFWFITQYACAIIFISKNIPMSMTSVLSHGIFFSFLQSFNFTVFLVFFTFLWDSAHLLKWNLKHDQNNFFNVFWVIDFLVWLSWPLWHLATFWCVTPNYYLPQKKWWCYDSSRLCYYLRMRWNFFLLDILLTVPCMNSFSDVYWFAPAIFLTLILWWVTMASKTKMP